MRWKKANSSFMCRVGEFHLSNNAGKLRGTGRQLEKEREGERERREEDRKKKVSRKVKDSSRASLQSSRTLTPIIYLFVFSHF